MVCTALEVLSDGWSQISRILTGTVFVSIPEKRQDQWTAQKVSAAVKKAYATARTLYNVLIEVRTPIK
jgi:hypothetical protein